MALLVTVRVLIFTLSEMGSHWKFLTMIPAPTGNTQPTLGNAPLLSRHSTSPRLGQYHLPAYLRGALGRASQGTGEVALCKLYMFEREKKEL